MRANQIRLYFSSIGYTLLAALRRIGLRGTDIARAQCNTIRTMLLKIGAIVGHRAVTSQGYCAAAKFWLRPILLLRLPETKESQKPIKERQ